MEFEGPLRFVVLGALSLLFFVLNAATFNGLGVILPYMVEELGWTWATAGVGFTLLGVACGLSGLTPAILIRRFGVSFTILSGGLVLLAGFACMIMTQESTLYFAGTILLGIGFSICGQVPAVNIISHSFQKHSTAIGFYFTVGGFGAVAGPIIAQFTQELTGEWRYYWAGAAVASVLLSVFTALVTATRWNNKDADQTKKKPEEQPGWPARAAMRTPQYYVIVGAYTSFLLINTTVHGFAVQHLLDLGMGNRSAAFVMSAIALISAGSSTVAGFAGERMKPLGLSLLSVGATAIGVLSLAAASNYVIITLTTVALGIGFGFSYVSVATLLLSMFGKRPNLELYSAMSLMSTTAAVGPAFGGFVRDQTGSFSMVFIACSALAFLFLGLLGIMKRPKPPAGVTVSNEPIAPAIQ